MARRGRQTLPSRVNDGYGNAEPLAMRRVEQRMVAQFSWSGPLPPAAELERYKAIMPDLPERLVANWEKQTDHRIELEDRVIGGDIRRANWGLIGGWIFAMTLLAASVYLIATGHEGIGVTGFLGELAVLGGAFLYSDRRRRQERNRKAGG